VYRNRDSFDCANWTLVATVPAAPFRTVESPPGGPFLGRFDISFPAVTARCVKVVTGPLSPAVPNAISFPTILISEIQGFVNTPGQGLATSRTQTFHDYNFDAKTRILDAPQLYHDFNVQYTEADPDGRRRYTISNGLFVTQRLTPILLGTANAAVEFGEEDEDTRTAYLYYASLLANPLPTLSNSLVFSGRYEDIGGETNWNNTLVLYNTAQLYRGLDANLNVGANYISQDQGGAGTQDRTELFANVSTGITPRPDTTLTASYFVKRSHLSGDFVASGDTWEHRVDLGASYTPFRTLFLSALVSALAETDRDTTVQQNYGLNWSPFPDGNLQFTFFYNESYTPDKSRIIQPGLRWYFTSQQRSYLDMNYQFINTESGSQTTDSHVISSTMKVYF
jgi:hypothetical protein